MGSNIFICYRREDSAGHTGHLFDALRQRFGKRVFIDIAGIESGDRFDEVIERTVGDCAALIVMIGNKWMTVRGAGGDRRLDDPQDYVRREVSTALRKKVRVFPVLVQGAAPPNPDELPDELKPLSKIQAQEITDKRWDYDAGLLIKKLEQIVKPSHFLRWIAAIAAAMAIFMAAYKWLPIRSAGTYSAVIWSWDSVDGWLELPIVLDGTPTGQKTPHTFPGLTGEHTFTMPCTNSRGRPFSDWSNDWKDPALTVKIGGTYTARYRDTYSATVWSWNNVDGWERMPIAMDGNRTAHRTPYTFSGLAGPHTFTLPEAASRGRRFSDWNNGWKDRTINVNCAGIYTGRYRE